MVNKIILTNQKYLHRYQITNIFFYKFHFEKKFFFYSLIIFKNCDGTIL
jgi:hypothetical protein